MPNIKIRFEEKICAVLISIKDGSKLIIDEEIKDEQKKQEKPK